MVGARTEWARYAEAINTIRERGEMWTLGNGETRTEGKAQEFSNELRRTLYWEHFEHDDPVHNAPTDGERARLAVWERLDKGRRALLARLVLEGRKIGNATRALFEPLTPEQRAFLGRWL